MEREWRERMEKDNGEREWRERMETDNEKRDRDHMQQSYV